MATNIDIQTDLQELVETASSSKKTASISSSEVPCVAIYAFAAREGKTGNIKPVGVGVGLSIEKKAKPFYFYTVDSVNAFLKTLSAPKTTPVAKKLLEAAHAVELYTTAMKAAKPSKAAAPSRKGKSGF